MKPNPPPEPTGGPISDTAGLPPLAYPAPLSDPVPAAIRASADPGRGQLAFPTPFSANRVRATPGHVYPLLLTLSTAMAALFCVMYITKPVILAIPPPSVLSATPVHTVPNAPKAPAKPAPDMADNKSAMTGLLPSGDRLPGEPASPSAGGKSAITSAAHAAVPSVPTGSPYEETNLRIQHILNAEGPDGFLARLDLDVPVLYQSRNLRWTPVDVTEARDLVGRLIGYQERTTLLRAEGGDLLAEWNRLMDRSLPVKELRADSPSLPSNQEDAADAPHPAVLLNTESIKIQPAGK